STKNARTPSWSAKWLHTVSLSWACAAAPPNVSASDVTAAVISGDHTFISSLPHSFPRALRRSPKPRAVSLFLEFNHYGVAISIVNYSVDNRAALSDPDVGRPL